MGIRSLIFICLLTTCLATAPSITRALAQEEHPTRTAAEWADFWKRQGPVIRIAIDSGPGNGHQAVAALIARKMRQLGFGGTIEVIYSDDEKLKLPKLFPGFSESGSNDQSFESSLGRMRVRSYQGFFASKAHERVRVGISGGMRVGRRTTSLAQLSKEFKCEYFIKLSPMGWWDDGIDGLQVRWRKQPNAIHAPEGESGFFVEPPTGLDAKATQQFIEQQFIDYDQPRSTGKALTTILNAGPQIETLAAYGLGHEGVPRLARLIEGIHRAAGLGPVIIPMVSRFNEAEWKQFDQAIRAARRSDRSLRAPRVVAVTDETWMTKTSIASLQAGDVLIVKLGAIPQPAMELLFARSTLPPTLSGTGLMTLMETLGLPYLDTSGHQASRVFNPDSWDTSTPRPTEEVKIQGLRAAYAMDGGARGDLVTSAPLTIDDIAAYLLAAKDAHSPLREFFVEVGKARRKSGESTTLGFEEVWRTQASEVLRCVAGKLVR